MNTSAASVSASSKNLTQIIEKLFASRSNEASLPYLNALVDKCTPCILGTTVEANAPHSQRLINRIAERQDLWNGVVGRIAEDGSKSRGACIDALCKVLLIAVNGLQGKMEDMRLALMCPNFPRLLLCEDEHVAQVAQVLLLCCSTTSLIEVLVRQFDATTTLKNVLTRHCEPSFVPTEASGVALKSLVMLVAHLLGRHMDVVVDFMESGLDVLLCKVGIRNVAIMDSDMGRTVQRAVLYCLRLFVRKRSTNVGFVESCLSMCAHSIGHLEADATDLCGDVCAVFDPKLTPQSNTNIFRNVVSLATRSNASRAHHLFRFLAASVVVSPTAVRAEHGEFAFAAAMKLCRRAWVDFRGAAVSANSATSASSASNTPELHIRSEMISELIALLCVCLQSGDRNRILGRTNADVMVTLRDYCLRHGRADPKLMTSFTNLHMQYVFPVPHPTLQRFFVPMGQKVAEGSISETTYNSSHPSIQPYERASASAFDKHILTALHTILRQLREVEGLEQQTRNTLYSEVLEGIADISRDRSTQRLLLEAMPSEIYHTHVDACATRLEVRQFESLSNLRKHYRTLMGHKLTWARRHAANVLDNNSREVLRSIKKQAEKLSPTALGTKSHKEFRTQQKKQFERVRNAFKTERDRSLANQRWLFCQGDYVCGLLEEYAHMEHDITSKRAQLELQLQEELVRGYGSLVHILSLPNPFEEGDGGATVPSASNSGGNSLFTRTLSLFELEGESPPSMSGGLSSPYLPPSNDPLDRPPALVELPSQFRNIREQEVWERSKILAKFKSMAATKSFGASSGVYRVDETASTDEDAIEEAPYTWADALEMEEELCRVEVEEMALRSNMGLREELAYATLLSGAHEVHSEYGSRSTRGNDSPTGGVSLTLPTHMNFLTSTSEMALSFSRLGGTNLSIAGHSVSNPLHVTTTTIDGIIMSEQVRRSQHSARFEKWLDRTKALWTLQDDETSKRRFLHELSRKGLTQYLEGLEALNRISTEIEYHTFHESIVMIFKEAFFRQQIVDMQAAEVEIISEIDELGQDAFEFLSTVSFKSSTFDLLYTSGEANVSQSLGLLNSSPSMGTFDSIPRGYAKGRGRFTASSPLGNVGSGVFEPPPLAW